MYCLGQWLSVSIINNKKKGIKELRCSQIFSNSQREYRIRIAGERTAGTGLEKALLENRRLQRVKMGEQLSEKSKWSWETESWI